MASLSGAVIVYWNRLVWPFYSNRIYFCYWLRTFWCRRKTRLNGSNKKHIPRTHLYVNKWDETDTRCLARVIPIIYYMYILLTLILSQYTVAIVPTSTATILNYTVTITEGMYRLRIVSSVPWVGLSITLPFPPILRSDAAWKSV